MQPGLFCSVNKKHSWPLEHVPAETFPRKDSFKEVAKEKQKTHSKPKDFNMMRYISRLLPFRVQVKISPQVTKVKKKRVPLYVGARANVREG